MRFSRFETPASFTPQSYPYTFTLTIQKGYNLFNETVLGSNIQVLNGDLIMITPSGGKVAVDTTSQIADYMISGNTLVKLNPNWRFYIAVIVSPINKTVGILKQYSTAGVYTVSTILSNSVNSDTQTQIINVQQKITNLDFLSVYGSISCFMNIMCGLQASYATGSNLNYQWTIDNNQTIPTTLNPFFYKFTVVGSFNVTLVAWNNISTANVTKAINVIDRMTGLKLYAGNSSNSASIVGQNANFLFTLTSGQNYNCSIDFGDGTQGSVTDAVYDANNTNVAHVYPKERMYVVNITCVNPVNSLTQIFNHYVQYAITSLAMVKNGSTLNTAYTIDFSTLGGSPPFVINFYLNNVAQTINQISNILFKSNQQAAATTATSFNVLFNISNYVSSQQYVGTFEISGPILNPTFSIYPLSDIANYQYMYPVNLTFSIGMATGSNVDIFINTDSTSNPSKLPNNIIYIQTVGDWYNNINDRVRLLYNITYVYANPGDYTIFVNVSNFLGYFTFSQSVKIVTKVDDLIPNLIDNTQYVVFLSADGGVTGQGVAQYAFNYKYGTKAGYGSQVTYWPGDTANSAYGPFSLIMDFNANISKTSLQYTYTKTGTYNVNFYVSNFLGSKSFTMTIKVVYALSGFFATMNPLCVKVNNPVNISAYIVQGNSITYNWIVDGISHQAPRTGIFF